MPRYFFEFEDDKHPDREGVDLADLPTAKSEMRRALTDMLKDEAAGGQRNASLSASISNDGGERVAKATAHVHAEDASLGSEGSLPPKRPTKTSD